jgi:uncharacterized protein YbcI
MADPAPIPSENCSPADGFCRTSPLPWSPCTKERFGRGPTRVRSHFAGPDALLCVMDDALLPAESKMVEIGEQQRVRESRLFFQLATADQSVATVRTITGRTVRAFASATDRTTAS